MLVLEKYIMWKDMDHVCFYRWRKNAKYSKLPNMNLGYIDKETKGKFVNDIEGVTKTF